MYKNGILGAMRHTIVATRTPTYKAKKPLAL